MARERTALGAVLTIGAVGGVNVVLAAAAVGGPIGIGAVAAVAAAGAVVKGRKNAAVLGRRGLGSLSSAGKALKAGSGRSSSVPKSRRSAGSRLRPKTGGVAAPARKSLGGLGKSASASKRGGVGMPKGRAGAKGTTWAKGGGKSQPGVKTSGPLSRAGSRAAAMRGVPKIPRLGGLRGGVGRGLAVGMPLAASTGRKLTRASVKAAKATVATADRARKWLPALNLFKKLDLGKFWLRFAEETAETLDRKPLPVSERIQKIYENNKTVLEGTNTAMSYDPTVMITQSGLPPRFARLQEEFASAGGSPAFPEDVQGIGILNVNESLESLAEKFSQLLISVQQQAQTRFPADPHVGELYGQMASICANMAEHIKQARIGYAVVNQVGIQNALYGTGQWDASRNQVA